MRGWGAAFVGLGLLASAGGAALQFGFAAAAIGSVGLAHGASDVAVVPAARRGGFVAFYLLTVAAVLLAWASAPVAALAAFLILSAAHFGAEDAPADALAERVCRGLVMVAGPALLHRATLGDLFEALVERPADAVLLADAMRWLAVGAVALLPLAIASTYRRSGTRGAGLLALGAGAAVLLPPLVGFTVAFTLLHAWPQLVERIERTGSGDWRGYALRHRATLAGAAGVVAATGWLFADRVAPAVSTLFAGLAALAVPHMLVTPIFERAPAPRRIAAAG